MLISYLFHYSSTSVFGRPMAVPLGGNLVEASIGDFQAFRLQFPDSLPPMAMAAHEACARKRVKMLGDRLAGHFGALAQPCDRKRPLAAQPRDHTQASRSPSAANTGTASVSFAWLLLRDIALNVLGLLRPAALIHAECLFAARERNLVEARFRDCEQGAPSASSRRNSTRVIGSAE